MEDRTGDLRYLLVDSGWLNSRRFLVPADQMYARGDGEDFYVNLRKADVEALPEFRDDALLSDTAFNTYESDYRRNWRYDADPARVRASSRLERFRNSVYHVIARDRKSEKRAVGSAEVPPSYAAVACARLASMGFTPTAKKWRRPLSGCEKTDSPAPTSRSSSPIAT